MWLVEARTVLGRARVRALLVVLAAVPVFLVVAVYLSGGPASGNGPPFVDRVSHNAVFAALAALTVAMPFFIPLSVAVVSGDAIAGEDANEVVGFDGGEGKEGFGGGGVVGGVWRECEEAGVGGF